MTFNNLPAKVERDIERYAQAEHLTNDEALVKLVTTALHQSKRSMQAASLSEADWDKLREFDPGFSFFEKMPDELLDRIEQSSKRIRSDRLGTRA